MRSRIPVLIVLLLSFAAPAAADPAVDAYVSWLGGPDALRGVETLRLAGTLEVSGLSGPVSVAYRRDGYSQTSVDLKVITILETITPDDAWERNASGQIEPMGADKARLARRNLARVFWGHLTDNDGPPVQVLPSEEKDGRAWTVLRVAYDDGDYYDELIDPQTGELGWTRQREDTEVMWMRYEDWRTVDGVRLPGTVHQIPTGAAPPLVMRLDTVEVNAEVPVSRFTRPDASARVAWIDGDAAATGWIPVNLIKGRYLGLTGTVNGAGTSMILDSGAAMTVLDRAFAKELGLEESGAAEARGVGGSQTAGFVKGVTIRVGQLELRDLTVAVIDFGDVSRRLGVPLPVVVGKEVFHAMVVDVDYPNSRIAFREPGPFTYGGEGGMVRLIPEEDGHRNLEIQVEGRPAVVGFDTGSGQTLTLFKYFTDEAGLLDARHRVSTRAGGGVGGVTVEQITTLTGVTIGGYTVRDVPCGFFDAESGSFNTKATAGNLGAGVLNRFRCIIDYSRDRMILEPGPGWDTDPFDKDRTGLTLAQADGGLEVVHVARNSPAERGGWKAGERVVELNGVPVGPDALLAFSELSTEPDGAVLLLRTASGEERKITLATYY